MTENDQRGIDALTVENLRIPKEKERYELKKSIIDRKLNRLLMPVMRSHEIDMWLIMSREFNPDPLLPDVGDCNPGVRSIFAFYDNGSEQIEKIFISSHQLRKQIVPDIFDQVTYYGYSKEGLEPHLTQQAE